MKKSYAGGPAWLALVSALYAIGVEAQVQQPDAGRILEQLKPAPVIPAPRAPATTIQQPRSGSVPQGGERIDVDRFEITGARAYPVETVRAVVANAEGKAWTVAELNDIADRITRFYRDRGYILAKAIIPAQDVTDRIVRIDILEGALGEVEINNPSRLSESALAPLRRLRQGQTLDQASLEASLLTLSELPGVDIQSTLRPGKAVGASDLLVDVKPGKTITGSMDADNHGSRYTGAVRAGTNVNINNPLNLGDQIGLGLQVTEESMRYARFSYQAPIGPWGTRVGASYSDLHYKLGKDFSNLDADGDARIFSVFVAHPLLRSRATSLYVNAQGNDKTLVDRVGSTRTETRKTPTTWSVGLSGYMLDGLLGGGSTQFALNYNSGKIRLDPVTAAIDAASARTQGNFDSQSLNLQRTQTIGSAVSALVTLSMQQAGKNLDSSEKFSLGGANGVRAYPQGEAAGDEGMIFNTELRWSINGQVQASTFYDRGRSKLNRNPFAIGVNERQIWGYGLGLSYFGGPNWLVKGFVAWRGSDQRPASEPDRAPRMWLQTRYFF